MDKSGQFEDAAQPRSEVGALARDLRRVVHHGLRVSVLAERNADLPALFALPTVRGHNETNLQRASQIVYLIRQTIVDLTREDVNLGDGLGRLLGVTDAESTESPVNRRRLAARLLVGWDQQPQSSLRRQEPKYLELLAVRLLQKAMEDSGLSQTPEVALPSVPPGSIQQVTLEQQHFLEVDDDGLVRRIDQINTIRFEEDGPFDVRRQFFFEPIFDIEDIRPITPATVVSRDTGFGQGLHLRVQVPSLPDGSLYTFGFSVLLKGGPLDYFTTISGRNMRSSSLVVRFRTRPDHVWRVGPVDTFLDIPSLMPDGADEVFPDDDGLYVARFPLPNPRHHVGLAWGPRFYE